MKKIEALLDAIGRLNGCMDPESDSYRLRNPLMLTSFAKIGKHECDEQGRRIFSSFLNGYKSATYDLNLKITGKSRAGIIPTDTVENLLRVYGLKSTVAADNVVSFVRRALRDPDFCKQTPLSYFIEDEETNEKVY
jgi:hypothetical protein